jgi:imidazolonepropionase-like amidohydrolase
MTKIFECGALVDGLNEEPRSDMGVLVDESRITSVKPREEISDKDFDQRINLSDKVVLPGLIDAHVHFKGTGNPNFSTTIAHGIADQVLQSIADLDQLLEQGITTVRDVGTESAIPLRDAVQKGNVNGPRILTSGGQIGQTSGQRGSLASRKKDITGISDIISSTDECAEIVRLRKRESVDLIKILATPSLKSGDVQEFSEEEIAAMVDEAHRQRLLVASHAHQPGGIRASLNAGVHTIEHGTYMHREEDLFDLMKESGAILVPAVYQLYKMLERDDEKKKSQQLVDATLQTILEAYKRDIPVAMGSNLTGTDWEPHGENLEEVKIYVNEAGMSEMDAIKSATSVAASALGTKSIGAIEEGRYADLIALDDNPLSDISNIEMVSQVFKKGEYASTNQVA